MNYSKFKSSVLSKVTGIEVQSSISYFGEIILESDGLWFISSNESFATLQEAKEELDYRQIKEDIIEDIEANALEDLSYEAISNIIKEHSDEKVTNTVIESYLDIANSKKFSLSPIVEELRKYNSSLVIEKIDFILNDGSIVAISKETLHQLQKLKQPKLCTYMSESKEQFLDVIKLIKE